MPNLSKLYASSILPTRTLRQTTTKFVRKKILVEDYQVSKGVTDKRYTMTVSKFKIIALKKYTTRYQVSYPRKVYTSPVVLPPKHALPG